ncbi:conserved Plasmodium protein, unknown function [Plasmodium ovale]|nr:conserved Plasmodium protein, unknown function [Plasmodium ovale]
MVKHKDYKKSDLIRILSSNISKERNKAVKLLKKFEPLPRKHLDTKFDAKNAVVLEVRQGEANECQSALGHPGRKSGGCKQRRGGLCCVFITSRKRYNKVNHVQWKPHSCIINLFVGMKIICTSCHNNLLTMKEVEKVRKENSTNTEILKNLNKI